MFSVKHNECVGFESRWKVTKVSLQNESQTEYASAEKSSSTTATNNVEIQTDVQEVKQPDVDMEKLAAWLSRIYPNVDKELTNAANSKAFKGYGLQKDMKDANCKLLQTLTVLNEDEGDQIRKVSTLTWNCTGKFLAVACSYDHSSWCHHMGFLYIYTLKNNQFEDKPKVFSSESCITIARFHPNIPSIIVCGNYSGKIFLWNIQLEMDVAEITVQAHQENITHIDWIPDINSQKNILLATSSTDGLMKLWNYDQTSGDLKIHSGYKVKVPLFGATKRETPIPEAIAKKVSRGILCFDFSKHVQDMFVVGAEGGLVVECSLSGGAQLNNPEFPLFDPVYKYYEPHEGEINSIAFSPNRKEMFMTSGTDLEIRIYLIGQEDPAHVLFVKNPVYSAAWVPFVDKLITSCGASGMFEIYHLLNNRLINNVTKEKVKKTVFTQLAINRDKSSLMVSGGANGILQLWDVPWNSFAYLYN